MAEDGGSRRTLLVPVEIAPGELLDKITILEIKSERMTDPARLDQVRRELASLRAARDRHVPAWRDAEPLIASLRERNAALWDVENALRAAEAAGDFGPGFVENARAVYRHNDARYALKRLLNESLHAAYGEQKDYGE